MLCHRARRAITRRARWTSAFQPADPTYSTLHQVRLPAFAHAFYHALVHRLLTSHKPQRARAAQHRATLRGDTARAPRNAPPCTAATNDAASRRRTGCTITLPRAGTCAFCCSLLSYLPRIAPHRFRRATLPSCIPVLHNLLCHTCLYPVPFILHTSPSTSGYYLPALPMPSPPYLYTTLLMPLLPMPPPSHLHLFTHHGTFLYTCCTCLCLPLQA